MLDSERPSQNVNGTQIRLRQLRLEVSCFDAAAPHFNSINVRVARQQAPVKTGRLAGNRLTDATISDNAPRASRAAFVREGWPELPAAGPHVGGDCVNGNARVGEGS